MTKFDPHHHERAYRWWKSQGMLFRGLNDSLASVLRQYVLDMEVGANVSPGSKRGPRGYGRLVNARTHMLTLALIFQEELGLQNWDDLVKLERELLHLSKRIREGETVAKNVGGKRLTALGVYIKVFKAFWHWYMRVQRREGRDVRDVTIDLDGRDPKPKFNYFTIDDLRRMCDAAKDDYRVMMFFLFDSGIRAPTEFMNVKVSDLEWNQKNNHYTLTIRDETSKTFGRKIKLLLCSEILKTYIERKKMAADDFVFTKSPQRANQYIKKVAYKVLGKGTLIAPSKNMSDAKIRDGVTLYDFRHSSACYWLVRYKSESALKYRFGWKRSEMIHYYTELLGMKDTIEEDDLYVDVTKADLEKQIEDRGKEITLLQEQVKLQDDKMKEIMQIMHALQLEKDLQATR